MHPDGVAEAVHAVVPNVIHQFLLTHGAPLMHHQVDVYKRQVTAEVVGSNPIRVAYRGFSSVNYNMGS